MFQQGTSDLVHLLFGSRFGAESEFECEQCFGSCGCVVSLLCADAFRVVLLCFFADVPGVVLVVIGCCCACLAPAVVVACCASPPFNL